MLHIEQVMLKLKTILTDTQCGRQYLLQCVLNHNRFIINWVVLYIKSYGITRVSVSVRRCVT